MAISHLRLGQTAIVVCYVHKTNFPRASCNEHHITPRGAGGGDEHKNLVYLCTNCHTSLHRCEELVAKGAIGQAADLIRITYQTAGQRARMTQLVNEAAGAFKNADENGYMANDAQVPVPRRIFERLQALASDVRDPITHKKVGTARYIEKILLSHLRSKGISI